VLFRSIRLNNVAFNNKVGSVCGGIELLLAAGYRFDSSALEGTVSKTTYELSIGQNENLPAVSLDLNPDNNPNGAEYLVHDMDIVAEKRLNYTLTRLNEIMEWQLQH
jgi:hypothetical protein